MKSEGRNGAELHDIALLVNGEEVRLQVKANLTLLELLRDKLGLMGAKVGCEKGDCGACTVLVEGEPVDSCLLLAVEADGRVITTIEGLEKDGRLDAVQETFIQYGAVQCGYCSPGMILSGCALLGRNPSPTEEEVKEAISGNLCRCTGYAKIVDAIMAASKLQLRPKV
ncbi:MAG: (2Fe-2S)-binding protein [Acidobacteriaceae bacterium]